MGAKKMSPGFLKLFPALWTKALQGIYKRQLIGVVCANHEVSFYLFDYKENIIKINTKIQQKGKSI